MIQIFDARGLPGFGLAVAALWGAADFLGGLATRKARAVFVVAVSHTVSFSLAVVAGFALHARVPDDREIFWAVVSGLIGGAALMIFYRALASGEMGLTAAVTGVLTAVVPVVFSWLTLGPPRPLHILGFAIAALAIYLIAARPGGSSGRTGSRPLALGLAIVAGLGFGVFLITAKLAGQGEVLWPLAYMRMMSASLAWAMLLGMGARRSAAAGFTWSNPAVPGSSGGSNGDRLMPSGLRGVILLAGGAGFVESSGNLLYMLTTQLGRLDIVAVLSSLYPAFTILLAIWILRERVSRQNAWGLILALLSVLAISI